MNGVLRRCAGLLGVLLVLLGMALLGAVPAGAQPARAANEVRVVRVSGVIDVGLAPYLSRALEEAERDGARAVLLEIDTPGGRLDAVLQMREAILASPVRTIAFVNREAFSAGALVAIAANEIYLTPGAVLGAATPVTGPGQPADAKTISAVRATFKATAEARGRDGRVAEAMVDPAVAIEGLDGAGQLLTLTDEQARRWGYSKATVRDRQELLQLEGLAGAPVRETAISPAETAVRLLTEPALAALLFSLGSLLIVGELFSGHFHGLSVAGAALLGLFFWGHTLAGLAGWEGVLLVLLGLALIAAEVLVIPGFGVAGVLGIAALLGGLVLSVIGGEIVTRDDYERAGTATGVALLTLLAGGGVLLWSLPKLARMRGMVLQSTVGEAEPLVAPARGGRRLAPAGGGEALLLDTRLEPDRRPSLVGVRGQATSDLRPGGFALLDGRRVDVVTEGDFIPAGERVEVVLDEGYRRVVRRLEPGEREPVEV